jgi:hypothetical protein
MPNIYTPYRRRKAVMPQKHPSRLSEMGRAVTTAMHWRAAVRPVLEEAMIVFPHMERRAHENTLHRIARHMRDRANQYQAFYIQFKGTIKPRHNDISEHEITLKDALLAVKRLPKQPTDPEVVHDALRKVSAAAHALIFLQQTEIDLLRAELAKRDEQLDQFKKTTHDRHQERAITVAVKNLAKSQVQALRDEVREMVFRGKPSKGIPVYRGLRGGDLDAMAFFLSHYKRYISRGQEVIFQSDLSSIDPKLMSALRNQCRGGIEMPLGTKSAKVDAVIAGRFAHESVSKESIYRAVKRRPVNPLQRDRDYTRAQI